METTTSVDTKPFAPSSKKRRELRKMSLRRDVDVRRGADAVPELSQITKCVFLGSLALKPNAHVFAVPNNNNEEEVAESQPEVAGESDVQPAATGDFIELSALQPVEEERAPAEAPRAALSSEIEKAMLRFETTPDLLLSDTDDDTIDQLMYNIMDIKIERGGYCKEFYDMPPSDPEDYGNECEENNANANEANIRVEEGERRRSKEKKYIRRSPQCKICSQIFPTYAELKQHKVEHNGDKPYLCSKCGENHCTLDQLLAHLRTHQGKRPYVCRKCNKSFKSQKSLDDHQPVHVLRKTVARKKTFNCDVCKKEFHKLCDLERHMRVHTGEKPSVCNICNRRFQQAHNLNKHLLIHTQEKPFQCDICGKKFGRNDALNRHLLTHSVKKPNDCDQCKKSFIRVSQLEAHKKKYHSNGAKNPISA